MPKLKSVPTLSQRTNKAMLQFAYLSNELRELRIETRKLHSRNGHGRRTKPNGVSDPLLKSIQQSKDLRQAMAALRKEVEQFRHEVRRSRDECHQLFRYCGPWQKFINCHNCDWEEALHSCLYKGIEAVLLNFDYDLHGQAGSELARKFESDFTLLPDWNAKAVRFKRRFIFAR